MSVDALTFGTGFVLLQPSVSQLGPCSVNLLLFNQGETVSSTVRT
jgi:hypothetical protein